jgi:hypothetical protein
MNAVTSALAGGKIRPGEAEWIAVVVETIARAITTTKRRELAVDPLQTLGWSSFDETDDCDLTRLRMVIPTKLRDRDPE